MAEYPYPASVYVISAICGNFWRESNINPGIWESLEESAWDSLNHGYGLGQWTNTGGDTKGRLYQLHEFLVNSGYEVDDGEGQLDYFLVESTWYPNSEYPEFNSLYDFFYSTSKDIAYLTKAFMVCWEGIHDPKADERVTHANKCYEYILANYESIFITDWIKGNRYLAEIEILDNSVMVYRRLAMQNPPEPPSPATKRKHMPVYMMVKYWR